MNPSQTIAAFLGITLIILSVHEFWQPEVRQVFGLGSSGAAPQTPAGPVPGNISRHDVTK